MFGGILGYIFGGLVIGLLARMVKPGADAMGWIMTILLGIGGSLLAGYIGQAVGWYHAGEGAGFIASVIVAFLILFIYGKVAKKK